METVNIASTVTGLRWRGATVPTFVVETAGPFITAEGIPINNGGGPFRETWAPTLNGDGYLTLPDVDLPPTENSSDPSTLYYAFFLTPANDRIPYATFGPGRGFRVPASPTTTTWADLAGNMGPAGPAFVADRTMRDLTVNRNAEIQGILTAPNISGPTVFDDTVTADEFIGDTTGTHHGDVEGDTATFSDTVNAAYVIADISLAVGAPGNVDGTNYETLINDGSVDIHANADEAHPAAIVQVKHGDQILWRGYNDRVEFSVPVKGVTSTRKVYASLKGAALNSDLDAGGGTDDTAAMQALLDLAASGDPMHIVIDGAARVGPLDIYSNTTLEFPPGCGFYLTDGSNRALLRNANPTGSGTPTDRNITLIGGIFNGNCANQSGLGAYSRREADGTLIGLVQFYGVDNLKVHSVTLNKSKSIALHLSNVRNFDLRDIQVDNKEAGEVQQGGIQIQGNCSHGTINGYRARTQDDALAFNSNDNDYTEAPFTGLGPYVAGGDITDISASNLVMDEAFMAVRMFSSTNRTDRIRISNITGTVTSGVFWNDNALTLTPGNIGTVEIEGVNVQVTGTPYAHPELTLPGVGVVTLFNKIENFILRNISVGPLDAGRAVVYVAPNARIRNLTVEGLLLHDSDTPIGAPPIRVEGKVSTFIGSNWNWSHSPSLGYHLYGLLTTWGTGAQITELILNGVTTRRVRDILRHSGGLVGSVQMMGIRQTDAGGGAGIYLDNATGIGDVLISNYWGENASPILANTHPVGSRRGDAFAIDTAVPAYSSSSTSAGSYVVRVTFSEAVNSGNYTQGVVIKKNTVAQIILSAIWRPSDIATVEFTLSAAVAGGDTLTWEYDSATGSITDRQGNALPTVTAQSVTNSGTVQIHDTFTASDGTANAGRTPAVTAGANTWTTAAGSAGTVKIVGSRLQLTDTTGVEKTVWIDSTVADGVISADLEAGHFSANDGYFGIIFRVSDANNFWLFYVTNNSGAYLLKVVAGVATNVGTSAGAGTLVNKRYGLSVTLSGNNITCKSQGSTVFTATDSFNAAQTKHGIRAYKGTVYVDDFQVLVP